MMTIDKSRLRKEKGSIALAIIFILLISFIGLSLLSHVITHQKIVKARTWKIAQTDRLYQNLIIYFHQLRNSIFSGEWQKYTEPEQEYFNRSQFPDYQNLDTNIENAFSYCLDDMQTYRKIIITDTVTAFSNRHPYRLKAGVIIKLLCGQIPLTFFPFFLNQSIDIPESTFLEENRITVPDTPLPVIDDSDIEFNTTDFLLHSLKIEGSCLTWRQIREKFGLPSSDAPVEEGIYFVTEGDCMESIFIQGDIERLIFSLNEGRQIVRIIQQGRDFAISYKPGEYDFLYPDFGIVENYLFKEKIIVNGNVWSLLQENDYAFVEQAHLTLLVSGQTFIHSSLKASEEILDLKKIKSTGLTLIASGHDLFTNPEGQSQVTVAAAEETELDISLVINGKLTNHSTDLLLQGSLFAGELQNSGSIHIAGARSNSDSAAYFVTGDSKIIHAFFIDYIEEVYP